MRPSGSAPLDRGCAAASEPLCGHYNTVRLHSAIGYLTPKDKLEGRERQVFAERDRKLEEARQQRQLRRQSARQPVAQTIGGETTVLAVN